MITGNIGRPGGGVASPRGPANYQGVTDMGAHPHLLPGGFSVNDAEARLRFEAAWMPHWGDRATTGNGFVPVRQLSAGHGLGLEALPAAIASGRVKAMVDRRYDRRPLRAARSRLAGGDCASSSFWS